MSKMWKYKVERDIVIEREYDFLANYDKVETFIFRWATIVVSKNKIRIIAHKGYAWDGCTPKFRLSNIMIGTWDGPILFYEKVPQTYYASLAHDILCQYLGKHSVTREQADKLFYELMKEKKFFLAPLYFIAVRFFALLFARRK